MDGQREGWTDGWSRGVRERQINGRREGWRNGGRDTDVWRDGWTDRGRDGGLEAGRDRQTDSCGVWVDADTPAPQTPPEATRCAHLQVTQEHLNTACTHATEQSLQVTRGWAHACARGWGRLRVPMRVHPLHACASPTCVHLVSCPYTCVHSHVPTRVQHRVNPYTCASRVHPLRVCATPCPAPTHVHPPVNPLSVYPLHVSIPVSISYVCAWPMSVLYVHPLHVCTSVFILYTRPCPACIPYVCPSHVHPYSCVSLGAPPAHVSLPYTYAPPTCVHVPCLSPTRVYPRVHPPSPPCILPSQLPPLCASLHTQHTCVP